MHSIGQHVVSVARGLVRRAFRSAAAMRPAAMLAAALALGAPAAANAQAFATSCGISGCHQASNGEPLARRLNATGPAGTNNQSRTVIWAASSVNGMGFNFPADVNAMIDDLRTFASTPADTASVNYTSAFTATVTVPYGGSRSATVPNLDLSTSAILTSASHSPAVSGVSFAGNVMTYTHTGGAGGNCNSQTVNAFGIGPAQGGITPQTANRVMTINISPPVGPNAPGTGSITIPYSTSPTPINVRALDSGSVSGTVSATGTNVQITAGLSLGVGSTSTTGTGTDENTFTYTASSTVWAPQQTIQFRVQGPCTTNSGIQTLTINVATPTTPPTVTNRGSVGLPVIVPAGTPTPIDLTANISGLTQSNPATAYALTASQPTVPGSGTTSVAGNVVTFTPQAGFTGATTFTYTKDGPGGTSALATVFLNVTAAPIVAPASVTTAFNTAVAVNLATACGGASCISSSQAVTGVTPSSPTGGTAAQTGTTTITFTPTAGFFGNGSFQYTATNAGGTSASAATVTVTVNPPPPTAGSGTVSVPFNAGTPTTTTSIDLAPFIGPAGAAVLSVNPGGATNGTVAASGPTTVNFTPTAGFIGPASFTYTATNVAGTSAAAGTITVNVQPPAPPVAAAQSVLVSSTAPTNFDLAASVSGLFTPPLQVVTQPSAGTIAFNGTVATYTPPAAGINGNLSFTYRAVGPGGPSAAATVTLRTVATPVAANVTARTPVNTAARIDLTDAFAGFVQAYRISSLPANGTATVNGAIVTYTPNRDFIGTDTFEFTGTGPGGTSAPGTATVTVVPPVAVVNGLSVTTPFNTPVTIDLTRAITGFADSYRLAGRADNGTVVISGSTATYTPNPGFSGADRFRITAVNGSGESEPGVISVAVGTLPPTARSATLRLNMNGSGTLDLAPFITGSGITGVNVTTLPNHGIADVEGTRIIYTPRTGYFGSDSFEFVAFGNAGRSPPVAVTVLIEGRPDPSQDKNVRAIVDNQQQAARRFSRAQITNFQRRMEALHVPGPVTPSAPDADADPAAKPAAAAPKAPASGFAGGLVPPPAALPGSPARATPGSLESTFANGLASLAGGRSLNLNASTDGARPAGIASGLNFWVGGTASFGTRSLGDDEGPYRFSTDGLSLGADRRLDDRLALGVGMGFARDESELGGDGTKNKSRGSSFAGYLSYHPTPRTYVDALVGFGTLKFDSDRYVEAFDESLTANRKGSQFFASVAGGYEHRVRNFLVAPYGRLDVTVDRLKAASESGSLSALTYEEQTQRTTSAAAGLRLESTHETDYGRVVPRARFEYRHDFEGGRSASISYADGFGGLSYAVSPSGTSKNALLVGVGSDFLFANGWKFGVDYQGERSSGPGTIQSVRFLASKSLDGKGLPAWSGWTMPLRIPVNVDFGMVWDDNLSRGRLDEEIRSDRVYTLNVNRTYDFPINKNARVLATALFTVDKPHTYTGLGHFAAGAQAELQYRRSGDFESATYAIYARGLYDQFESDLRTGPKYSIGANLRRALTDRIDFFADLSHHRRFGRSAVFETKETAGRVNFDYSLGKQGTLYLSGEYRKGDIFSSGFASLTNIAIADVAVADDAFSGGEFFAYRFDGKTVLGTFGWNKPLGARDAIDFSVRRVQSTPSLRPEFDEGGRLRYIVNQYSLLYLLRF